MVIDDTESVEGIYAFIYCTKWRSGKVSQMPDGRTDGLTDGQTLKDRATQLLINAIKLFSFFLGDPVYHTQSEYIID